MTLAEPDNSSRPIAASAQYDTVGEKYAAFKRRHVPVPEEHTVRRLLRDIRGARVLDLACGFGHYTRLVKELGAATAAGVDISGEMVALARRAESEEPRGITYHVHDVARMPCLGSFDVATAVWLFNYASSIHEMTRMFRGIRTNLTPGGRLVAVTVGPDFDPYGPSWEPYGLRVMAAETLQRKTDLSVQILTDPPTELRFTRWDRQAYEESAGAAGFTELTWHPAMIPEGVVKAKGESFWAVYRANPFLVAFECS
ncbi:class I SAM-dependent methyltransferase [Streptomyces blastmyceticus]|uniref:Methyltransferase domain-containing protein n=1 Tax=Streptomyces blastmyceticus TaxID=68180 RepID=A0ABN0WWK0_9ACTN